MPKHLLTIGLSFLTAVLLSACEVPNTPNDDNNPATPAASASPANSDTSVDTGASAGASAGKPSQAQYVAAMQCAATALAESDRTMSRIYEQQAQVVGGWPAEMWASIGLMDASAQMNAYAQLETLAPACRN